MKLREVKRLVDSTSDPALAVDVQPLSRHVGRFYERPRFQTAVLIAFALTGLALAVLGLYSLVSFLVVERTREIGVRMALGASPGDVERLFVRRALRWVTAGALAGIVASAAITSALRSLLYQVRPNDPAVYGAAVTVLIAAALAAAWIPARRASRLEPLRALRHE